MRMKFLKFDGVFIWVYYIDTDEIPRFSWYFKIPSKSKPKIPRLKNQIFIARSKDTIFLFHV